MSGLADDLFEAGRDRYDLQDRYLALMRRELPAAARQHGWLIREDHCFMRIVLDQLFGDCWYRHMDRRLRAYKQLNTAQLAEAVALGQRLLEEGESLVNAWNAQSLAWRSRS